MKPTNTTFSPLLLLLILIFTNITASMADEEVNNIFVDNPKESFKEATNENLTCFL